MNVFIYLIFTFFIITSSTFSQDVPTSIGSITDTLGSGFITRSNEQIQIKLGIELIENDLITTNTQSVLRAEFTDGSVVVIGENSKVKISSYQYNSKERKTKFIVEEGKLKSYISDKSHLNSTVILKTNNITSSVTTGFLYIDASKEMYVMEEGYADITNNEDTYQNSLKHNEYCTYSNGQISNPLSTTGIVLRNFDDLTVISLNPPEGADQHDSLSNTKYTLEDNAIGIITLVEGKSTVITNDKEITAKDGLNVFIGTEIETSEDALVKIIFIDDSTIVLTDNAYLELTEFIFNKKKRVNRSKLLSGKMKSFTKKYIDKKSTVEIETTNAVAGVKGTILYVDGDEEVFGVEKGEVEVTGSKDKKNKVKIKDGQYTKVTNGIASTPKAMTSAILKPFNKLLGVPVVNKVPLVKSIVNAPKKILKLVPFF